MEKVKGKDLNLLLEVDPGADEKTIKTAFRKKALTCHPDKNSDIKDAALFRELSDALKVLANPSTRRTRKEYDTILKLGRLMRMNGSDRGEFSEIDEMDSSWRKPFHSYKQCFGSISF